MTGRNVRRPGTGVLVVLLFCLALSAASCGAAVSFTFTGKEYPAWDGPVWVFKEAPKGYYYEEIGLLSVKVGPVHFDDDLVEKLKEKAARHGGNAIILLGYDRRRDGAAPNSRPGYDSFPPAGGPMDMSAVAIRIIE
ncbi:MAG: hypothetical protein V1816_15810 [Pseudomonadota bacterium]